LVRNDPFAETKNEVPDCDIIECADFDEAIEIASKHAGSKAKGEVRIEFQRGYPPHLSGVSPFSILRERLGSSRISTARFGGNTRPASPARVNRLS
jgi:hypothetical protein